jgi:acyl-CoA synthetase (AMP-forming)/AMP-acid ligase II
LGHARRVPPIESVRHVLMSGEPLTDRALETARAIFPRARLHHFYASTQTGPVLLLDDEHMSARSGLSGYPLPGVEVRLVSSGNEPVDDAPTGTGELQVRSGPPGSWYTSLGYVSDTGTPLADGDGWVDTGDIARPTPDGGFAVVDRATDMILTGAMNVSPREVEAVMGQHPAVLEVAVIGVPDERYGERIVAFVVAAPAEHPVPAELIQFVATRAASYKKPSAVLLVDELPRLSTGKVDKAALRATHHQRAALGSHLLEHQSEVLR